MTSRERILAAVKTNQPTHSELPDLTSLQSADTGNLAGFCKMVESLGASCFRIDHLQQIPDIIHAQHAALKNIIAADPAFYPGNNWSWQGGDGRQLQHVDMAIIPAQLGVAENGAVWIAERHMQARALPFIPQHLSIVLSATDIVPTMHDAYNRLEHPQDGFGVFLAGPSKTADIEQSLVLGAHGAKSLLVFLLAPTT